MNTAHNHIECQHISKSFEQKGKFIVPVLRDLSFGVAERELLVVLGPGQSGKSTLLRLIAGLEKPDSGRILMRGNPITGPGPDRGLVFQSYMLFPWLSVLGNVEAGLNIRNKKVSPCEKRPNTAESREKAMHYLEMVGLAEFASYHPHQLSGGMKQRVGIARAYALEPEVMLLDEPFGQLDAQTRLKLELETERIWQANKCTMIFVTNNIDEAICLADRIIILDGKLPGHLASVHDVPFARPRDHMNADFLEFREEITAKQKIIL